jgi:hypothetical protein
MRCEMGRHDAYGKAVLKAAAGPAFQSWGPEVSISYGTAGGATIDGVVGDTIAVEVESRVSKQVRGAVLDLLCHRYPKKLLVLLPVHMSNARLCSDQCRNILSRFVSQDNYRVIVLNGSGDSNSIQADVQLVRMALEELGFLAQAM